MAESNITMNALIFQCRWETKILHTIFSYIFTYLSNDMRCGNNISHSFFKYSNEIYGGIPPTLNDIKYKPIWWIFLSILCLSTEHNSHIKQISIGLLILLLWYFVMHFLGLLLINRLVSTRIQPIIPSITILFPFLHKQKFQWRPFANVKMNSLQVLKKLLVVDVSKVGQVSGKRYVNSHCAVRVIDDQGETIGRLHQTIRNSNKGINIMSTTMGGMGQDSHNMGKEM